MVGAEPLDERADEGRGEARVRDGARREGGAYLAVDVLHAVFARDLGEVGRPFDAPGLLELGEHRVRLLQEGPQGAVVHDEVELRPVFGRLAHVLDRRVLPDAGPGRLVVGRQQPLVDADGRDVGLHGLLVKGIHQLVVVEPPVRLQLGREQRIADRVALPAVGLEGRDRAIHFLHPSLLLRREHGVAQETARTGELVDGHAGGGDLVVGQEVPAGVVEGRAREQRHLGVAVDEDLLDVVLELVPGQVVFAPQLRVPVLFGVLGQIEQALLLEVVADEVRLGVNDELSGERLRAHVGDARCGRFRPAHVEHGTEDVVHREEGGGHAGAGR